MSSRRTPSKPGWRRVSNESPSEPIWNSWLPIPRGGVAGPTTSICDPVDVGGGAGEEGHREVESVTRGAVEVRGEDLEDEALALAVLARRTIEAVGVGVGRGDLVVEEAHREPLAAIRLAGTTDRAGAIGIRRAGLTVEITA